MCYHWARLTDTRLFAFGAPRGMAAKLQHLDLSVVGEFRGKGATHTVAFDRLVQVLPYTPALLYLRAEIVLVVPSENDGGGDRDGGDGEDAEHDENSRASASLTPAARQRHAFKTWNASAARFLPALRTLRLDFPAPVDDDDAPLRPTNTLAIAFPILLQLQMRVARR